MVHVTYHIPDTDLLTLFLTTPLSASRQCVLFVVLALFLVLPFFLRRRIVDKDGHPIPPGPLLRYAFLRPWARSYGPLFSVWMGNQLFVVVSDARIAKDLLVSNGAIFSSRKRYFMKNQTILRGAPSLRPHITTLGQRQHRRIAAQLLTQKAIQGYASVLDYEAHILVRSLYHESRMGTLPINPAHFADSTLDPLTERALALATEFMDLTVDPTRTRSRGRRLHDGIVEARMDEGEDVPDCLVKTLLLCMLSAYYPWRCPFYFRRLLWFLALISSHPDVQEKAHAELDTRLPYIRAIIKEVERAHSPFWMATPHYSTEDFVYNGMYIPKNTEKYPDSFSFNPDRYMGDTLTCAESSKLPNAMDRDHWAFGAGRRICPGIHVAERELWLAISRLLWAFDIRCLPDEPISLEEYEGESGRTPLPYRVTLTARHDRVQALLEAEQEVTLMKL
ncbi:cytochrome P450 [Lactarius quietus]|nr:cytochrome P450 [Lactarius quietus]